MRILKSTTFVKRNSLNAVTRTDHHFFIAAAVMVTQKIQPFFSHTHIFENPDARQDSLVRKLRFLHLLQRRHQLPPFSD